MYYSAFLFAFVLCFLLSPKLIQFRSSNTMAQPPWEKGMTVGPPLPTELPYGMGYGSRIRGYRTSFAISLFIHTYFFSFMQRMRTIRNVRTFCIHFGLESDADAINNTLKVVAYNSILGFIAFSSAGAIRQFCTFAVVVLVAHWFLAHTFFLAVLSIDIQRLEVSSPEIVYVGWY
jgi:hypothetical protein